MRSDPPVIGFVGPSGVGKTTLLEHVVSALEGWGVSVGVVKHTCHSVEADRPGKDSHRLYTAGAHAVALASPDKIVVFQRRNATPPGLEAALRALPAGLEVVLVEGFLGEGLPRYVVHPPDAPDERGYLEGAEILRVIDAPPRAPGRAPQFDPALIKEIAGEIAARAAGPARSGRYEARDTQ